MELSTSTCLPPGSGLESQSAPAKRSYKKKNIVGCSSLSQAPCTRGGVTPPRREPWTWSAALQADLIALERTELLTLEQRLRDLPLELQRACAEREGQHALHGALAALESYQQDLLRVGELARLVAELTEASGAGEEGLQQPARGPAAVQPAPGFFQALVGRVEGAASRLKQNVTFALTRGGFYTPTDEDLRRAPGLGSAVAGAPAGQRTAPRADGLGGAALHPCLGGRAHPGAPHGRVRAAGRHRGRLRGLDAPGGVGLHGAGLQVHGSELAAVVREGGRAARGGALAGRRRPCRCPPPRRAGGEPDQPGPAQLDSQALHRRHHPGLPVAARWSAGPAAGQRAPLPSPPLGSSPARASQTINLRGGSRPRSCLPRGAATSGAINRSRCNKVRFKLFTIASEEVSNNLFSHSSLTNVIRRSSASNCSRY